MTKPNFTHAKKILTALEDGKHILIFKNDKWEDSKLNGLSTSIRIDAINDPKVYKVMELEFINEFTWIPTAVKDAIERLKK